MPKLDENFYTLKCIECAREYDEHDTCTTCTKCGGSLDAIYNYDFIKSRLNLYALKNSPISALKYLTLYPILNLEKIVTLNEGGTPLHHAKNLGQKYNLKNLFVKNEGANPTGVFKDRGTLVEVTKALEIGAKAVCLASTGNMAASVAAYCSIAKMPCYVLVPEGTPIGKLAQSLSYGARIVQVRGDYSTCARLAEEMAKKHKFYLAGDYVFRQEGQKSQGYEIAEQLGWRSPDYLICPVGVGTNLAAIYKGFKELHLLGLIDKLPKIIAVQPTGANAVYQAFKAKKKKYSAIPRVDTICSAVAVANPFDGNKVLNAVYETKGIFLEIPDDEVLHSQQLLAKEEAMFVEPSAALPIAALEKLTKQKFFKPTDTVVCVATGNGLKDPKSATKILPDPPTIDAQLSEIDTYLKHKLYQIQSEGIRGRTKVLWKKIPAAPALKKIIKEQFGISLQEKIFQGLHEDIKEFETKGKELTKQDLQNILETALDEYATKQKHLDIIDFEAKTSKYNKATASVKIKFGTKELIGQSSGVGAVDAIISAIKTCIKDHDKIEVRLTDYNVEIFTGGVSATVKVTMTAMDKDGNKIIAVSTSPDVIVASVTAFEKCYNFLYQKHHV
ncbi:threonine synthase [Candidatus Gracilibacteria bacterium]|nr:threonine synthase [Candidatus Gracilibacteria bacterium]